MSSMVIYLDKIVKHLRKLGRSAPNLLKDPLLVEDIQLVESKLPFSFSAELFDLYCWRNGTESGEGVLLEDTYFFPGFYFLSLEEAFQIYVERKDAPQWKESWFPVFADGAGDFYIIPCAPKKLDHTEVIGFIHGEPEQMIEYESLLSMIKTIEACFAERAFYINDDDTMEIDDDKQREIAIQFNPEVALWQN